MMKKIKFLDRFFVDLDVTQVSEDKAKELTALIEQFNNILDDFIERKDK